MDALNKEKARRRVFVFLAILIVFAIGHTIFGELKEFADVADDIVLVGSALVTLALFLKWKGTEDALALRKQHKAIMILFVAVLLVQIAAFPIEMDDVAAFGNEIPSLMLIVLFLVNYFV